MTRNPIDMISRLETWFAHASYYFSLRELFTWEIRQTMPKYGITYREDMTAAFSDLEHTHLHGKEAMTLYDWFRSNPPEKQQHQAMVRELNRTQRFHHVPSTLMSKKQSLIPQATALWDTCYARNAVHPWLEIVQQIMDVHREIASYVDDSVHPMQVWIENYEFDLQMTRLDRFFSDIQQAVVPIVNQYPTGQSQPNRVFPPVVDSKRVRSFCQQVGRCIGYQDEFGVWGETRLPFSSIIGPQDVRIAVNYSHLPTAVLGTLHEVGHAVYSAYAHPDLHTNGLWRPMIGAYDEAMAIFWERMIGLSPEFWQYQYPILQKTFPTYQSITIGTFLEDLNAVRPSAIRVESDELTYPLHIMLRYNLEKQLLDGSLKAAQLPNAWRSMVEETLGVVPEDDRQGCLQDVHWSLGLIGYFPSYTLGGMMAAQIHAAARQACVIAPIADGDYQPLLDWMILNCYQQGMTEIPRDSLLRITGKPLGSRDYVDYLAQKYSVLV